MSEDKFFYTVGTLVVANIMTIIAVLFAGAKGVWWMAKLDAKVDKNVYDTNAAHVKIRDLENHLRDQ